MISRNLSTDCAIATTSVNKKFLMYHMAWLTDPFDDNFRAFFKHTKACSSATMDWDILDSLFISAMIVATMNISDYAKSKYLHSEVSIGFLAWIIVTPWCECHLFITAFVYVWSNLFFPLLIRTHSLRRSWTTCAWRNDPWRRGQSLLYVSRRV